MSLYIEALDSGIAIYGGLFHLTSTSQIFQLFIFLLSGAILQLTAFYPRKVWVAEHSTINKLFLRRFIYNRRQIINQNGEQFKIIEYPLILLFTVTGAIFLQSSSDLVSIFLSIELQSYGLYLLSTIYRNSEEATGGGLTYFLLGGLSSCFILLGISLLYANSGTTNLDGLYIITSLSDLASLGNSLENPLMDSTVEKIENSIWYKGEYIDASLVIFSVGFLFKISAAPFHFWSPDVYDAIPTIVTTFVAIVAKISILIMLLELVHYTTNSYFALQTNTSSLSWWVNSKYTWSLSLLYSSLLSLIIGTVVGLTQFRIKRLFAYSTISHVGFILLALSINSIESIQAFIFYLMQYSISNLNAFMIIISIGYSLYYYINDNKEFNQLKDKNNSPIQLISQMKGYFYINGYLALSLAITIFSFAGIPPLVGFFAKQMVLSAALDSGYVFLTLVAILTSVIGAVYYLGVIKQVFFDKSEYRINPVLIEKNLKGFASLEKGNEEAVVFKFTNIVLSSYLTITISILTLIIMLFIFIPKEWLNLANILALIIWNS
jgi:NADH-ubiquinone oxidoreductase chain 2